MGTPKIVPATKSLNERQRKGKGMISFFQKNLIRQIVLIAMILVLAQTASTVRSVRHLSEHLERGE